MRSSTFFWCKPGRLLQRSLEKLDDWAIVGFFLFAGCGIKTLAGYWQIFFDFDSAAGEAACQLQSRSTPRIVLLPRQQQDLFIARRSRQLARRRVLILSKA